MRDYDTLARLRNWALAVEAFRNRLLSQLPREALALVLPHLVKVPLVLRQPVEVKRRPIAQAYFVERGFISVVTSGRMPAVEIGLIGNEGFAGWPLMLGV